MKWKIFNLQNRATILLVLLLSFTAVSCSIFGDKTNKSVTESNTETNSAANETKTTGNETKTTDKTEAGTPGKYSYLPKENLEEYIKDREVASFMKSKDYVKNLSGYENEFGTMYQGSDRIHVQVASYKSIEATKDFVKSVIKETENKGFASVQTHKDNADGDFVVIKTKPSPNVRQEIIHCREGFCLYIHVISENSKAAENFYQKFLKSKDPKGFSKEPLKSE